MYKKLSQEEFYNTGQQLFLPSISLDCVIFGFHDQQLKVLLLYFNSIEKWALPGGFIYKDEGVQEAAIRVLRERTQLQDIYLKQFYVFGEPKRDVPDYKHKFLGPDVKEKDSHWLLNRFVTIGFYALVDYSKVQPMPDEFSEACTWWDVNNLPEMMFDHQQIIEEGLKTLRQNLKFEPIGLNLLPEEFTIKDLHAIYETILGRTLDRGNFQRKLLNYNILDRKRKNYSGGAHKAPYVYSFNLENYKKSLEEGFGQDW